MRSIYWRMGALAAVLIGSIVYWSNSSNLYSNQRSNAVEILTLKVQDSSTIQALSQAGFDIAGIDFGENLVDIIVDETSKQTLLSQFQGVSIAKSTPIDPAIAPDQGFTKPAELNEFLYDLADRYPEIARLEVVGKSHEGRDIIALKISDNPNQRELDEPSVLFNGMHHSREVMTTEVVMDAAEYLLTRYGSDQKVTDWVENAEIWVLPMLNPDGNNKVWNGSSMWRKNTRESYGVDLNRNYPYNWNSCKGSSCSPFSQTYRGRSPGSEPETKVLMGLVERIQPVFDISYHSYSELVIYPYGCPGKKTATREVVEGIGKKMASLIPSDTGRGTYRPGTAWELLYAADGGDIDWMYGAHHVIPYVVELNSSRLGFQPDYRWRQPTVEKARASWSFLLDRLTQSGIRGVVRDQDGKVQTNGTVTFSRVSPDTTDPITFNIKNDGTYHLVLLPGTYRLDFKSSSRSAVTEVAVGSDLLVQDIEI